MGKYAIIFDQAFRKDFGIIVDYIYVDFVLVNRRVLYWVLWSHSNYNRAETILFK